MRCVGECLCSGGCFGKIVVEPCFEGKGAAPCLYPGGNRSRRGGLCGSWPLFERIEGVRWFPALEKLCMEGWRLYRGVSCCRAGEWCLADCCLLDREVCP